MNLRNRKYLLDSRTKSNAAMKYGHWYRDGEHSFVVVLTGQPSDNVEIGVGRSMEDAIRSMEETPIQSVGRDNGLADALEWAHWEGWISRPNTLHKLPKSRY